jgi:hypothetical protein
LKNKPSGLLNKSTVKEMLTPVLPSSGAALGVFITEKGGEKYFTHSGSNIGYRSDYYGSFSTGVGLVVLINSDNGQLINEIINSVATVYGWKGFYSPETRKLVVIPDTLADKYIGEYYVEKPAMKVIIAKRNSQLELTTHAGTDNFEKMYFTGDKTFFLLSSPSTIAQFLTSDDNTNAIVVKEGKNILFTAKKKQ